MKISDQVASYTYMLANEVLLTLLIVNCYK